MTLPDGVERDYPLARLTTVRAGGPADLFARPDDERSLRSCSAGRRRRGWRSAVVGSGSNLLVSDDGYRGLVLKLDGRAERDRAPGHARRLRRRRPASIGRGSGGSLGTRRARVRDQHPGDGRRRGEDERQRLRRRAGPGAGVGRTSAPPAGVERREPGELGFSYRRSNLGPGEVVSRASFRLGEGEVAEIKGRLAEMRGKRREAQPSGIKTFGSTFKNPADDRRARGADRRPAAGGRGLSRAPGRRRPLLREARQLRRERRRRDHRRHPRPDGRGAPPRPRALRGLARAGGPGAGRGRVARGLGPDRLTRSVGESGQEPPPGSANHPPVRTPAATAAGKRRATRRAAAAAARPAAPLRAEAGAPARADGAAQHRSRAADTRPSPLRAAPLPRRAGAPTLRFAAPAGAAGRRRLGCPGARLLRLVPRLLAGRRPRRQGRGGRAAPTASGSSRR